MSSIVHLITTINRGGAENQLLLLAEQQVLLGNKVEVIFLKGTGDLTSSFIEVGATVQTRFANRNIFFQIISIRNYLRNFSGFRHAHLPRAELLSCLTSSKRNLIVSRHNAEPFFPAAPAIISILLSRFVEKKSNTIICISEAVFQFLLNSREVGSARKLKVLLYGFTPPTENLSDLSSKIRASLNITKDTFLIGTVSRLVGQKNIPCLMKAFRIVQASQPNSKLIIVGGGPLEEELKKFAVELKVDDHVIWVNHSQQVLGLLAAMDVFALTSYYEGFGMVLLESLSSNIPIVASNVSAIPEVLGISYPFLAKVDDEADFASKILEFQKIENQEWFEVYSAERILNFDSKLMAKKLSNLYMQSYSRSSLSSE
jgi:glycosyltransferase involved in cell wall biosynthesis